MNFNKTSLDQNGLDRANLKQTYSDQTDLNLTKPSCLD